MPRGKNDVVLDSRCSGDSAAHAGDGRPKMKALPYESIENLWGFRDRIYRFALEILLATIGPTIVVVLVGGLIIDPIMQRFIPGPSSPIPFSDWLVQAIAGAVASWLFFWRTKKIPSHWVWVPATLWLFLLARDDFTIVMKNPVGYQFVNPWRYVYDNYIGTNCSGSECLGEFFGTMPFASSVAYSLIGLFLRKRGKAKTCDANQSS
jgi:hypothetical protein